MELKLSDEQYEKIWQAVARIGLPRTSAGGGRAAVDAVLAEVLPVVLGEPSEAEVDQVVRKGLGFGPIAKVSPDFHYGARLVFANRLSLFTAPKDAAVEAVRKVLGKRPIGFRDEDIAPIVAAVRAADREAGR